MPAAYRADPHGPVRVVSGSGAEREGSGRTRIAEVEKNVRRAEEEGMDENTVELHLGGALFQIKRDRNTGVTTFFLNHSEVTATVYLTRIQQYRDRCAPTTQVMSQPARQGDLRHVGD